MKWELYYLNKSLLKKLESVNTFIIKNNLLINLWDFINPGMINHEEFSEKAFYADFYKNGYVYRIGFMAFKGTKEEANKILLNMHLI